MNVNFCRFIPTLLNYSTSYLLPYNSENRHPNWLTIIVLHTRSLSLYGILNCVKNRRLQPPKICVLISTTWWQLFANRTPHNTSHWKSCFKNKPSSLSWSSLLIATKNKIYFADGTLSVTCLRSNNFCYLVYGFLQSSDHIWRVGFVSVGWGWKPQKVSLNLVAYSVAVRGHRAKPATFENVLEGNKSKCEKRMTQRQKSIASLGAGGSQTIKY